MGWFDGNTKQAAKAAAAKAARRAVAPPKQRGFVTEKADGDIRCRGGCGRKVRSRFGNVCSDRKCHLAVLHQAGSVDMSEMEKQRQRSLRERGWRRHDDDVDERGWR